MSSLDPMGFARDLDCMADYFPLGFPLRLWSNSDLVMDAAASSWATFPAAFATPQLQLHAVVETGAEELRPTPPDYRGRESLLMITGVHDSAVCDHAQGFAFCRLSEATARLTAFTSYYYLEAIALHLLTQLYVTPVHAACLIRDGVGVLLCGESGAGKSSLAYECAKRGWCYVSDNESWLLRDHEGTVVLGNPTRIRFSDSAPELFPELRNQRAFLFANGKKSLALELNSRPEFTTAYRASISHVVFLDRSNATGIYDVSKEETLQRLLSGVPVYSQPVRQQHEASLRKLARANTVRLAYQSLETGVALLGELVGKT
jgi:hypothetical protein